MKKMFTMMIVLIMLGALLAACGSNNEANSNPNNSDSANNSGNDGRNNTSASGEPINIGFLSGLTGWLAPFATENLLSLIVAEKEINAAGGILGGREVNLIDIDTASTVEGAIKGYQKLVNIDKAVAAIGLETESYLALLEEAPKSGVVIMSEFAGSSVLDDMGGNYAWRTAASDSTVGDVRANIIIEEGYNEIAILVANYEGAQSEVEHFKEVYQQLGGTILTEVTFNVGQNSYNGELQQIADVNPELVVYAGSLETAPMIFKSAQQRDYNWQWYISHEATSEEFIDAIGADVAEGIKAVIPMEDEQNPNFIRFNEAFEAEHGRKASAGYANANTYDLLIVAALAMEAGGDASGKAINDNIRSVTNPDGVEVNTFEEGIKELRAGNEINYQGASGLVDFDEKGNVLSTYALMEAQNGDWKQVQFFESDYLENK